ncbi:MAG: hypothetical protein LN588_05710 [Rickettsia endosymbiont of Bryobia graminum]|nr:hypothetical protein [Rickettsia endosymbiont of Bryobia graminum]
MSKVHVFRYSQVVETDESIAVQKFARESSLPSEIIASIVSEAKNEKGIIAEYKCGRLDDSKFRAGLMSLIEKKDGTNIEDDTTFDACWNSMCVVNPETVKKLYNIQLAYNCYFHIVGNTNSLQHNFIQNKISEIVPDLKISYTLSFKIGNTKEEKLKDQAIDDVEKTYPESESIFYYPADGSNLHLQVEV